MTKTTRTLNPLPFQDLEPKRFEDLVRQLLYDFRSWRLLEATGRGGADDGFDARGYEQVPDSSTIDLEGESQSLDDVEEVAPDRLWLIQCKRERSITPGKMVKHLLDIPEDEATRLYGLVFAVACDVSKATRDVLRRWCAEQGIQEAHVWAKSELEDLIFQPRNDHLLFAYFGISLQIRRRSIRIALRARLATKRRCEKVLTKGQTVLMRDPEDDRYPYWDEDDKSRKRGWRVTEVVELHPRGLILLKSRYFAYLSDDETSWDCLEKFDDSIKRPYEDPWAQAEDDGARLNERAKIADFWASLPDKNRAWATEAFLIRYDQILAIDETGDAWASYPHIYLEPDGAAPTKTIVENVVYHSPKSCYAEKETRISMFPPELQVWRFKK